MLLYIRTLSNSVDKAPADLAALGPLNVKTTKIGCGSFRSGLRSYRREYSGFLLGHLGETSVIIIGGSDYRVAGRTRPVIYDNDRKFTGICS